MRRIAVFWIAVLAVLCAGYSAYAVDGLTKVSENVYSYVGSRTIPPPGASEQTRASSWAGTAFWWWTPLFPRGRPSGSSPTSGRPRAGRPLSAKKDISDMKGYLVEFDRRAREISGTSEDPDYITAEMIKVLPSRKHGAGLIKYSIVMKYFERKE